MKHIITTLQIDVTELRDLQENGDGAEAEAYLFRLLQEAEKAVQCGHSVVREVEED